MCEHKAGRLSILIICGMPKCLYMQSVVQHLQNTLCASNSQNTRADTLCVHTHAHTHVHVHTHTRYPKHPSFIFLMLEASEYNTLSITMLEEHTQENIHTLFNKRKSFGENNRNTTNSHNLHKCFRGKAKDETHFQKTTNYSYLNLFLFMMVTMCL